MQIPEWIAVTLKVIDALEALSVPYALCGSASSIVHGVARSTIDTDIIADLKPEHVKALVASLTPEFYIEEDSVRAAISRRQSFNLIHFDTVFKVDVFLPKNRPFDVAQIENRVQRALGDQLLVFVTSAEDIVLAKLEWYQIGGSVSERQWRDVLGVLKTQLSNLNLDYMRKMAVSLKVSESLEAALAEAQRTES